MMYVAYIAIAIVAVLAVGAAFWMKRGVLSQHATNTAGVASELASVSLYATEIGQGVPVCVVAYHKRSQIIVGLTEDRILIKPQDDKVHEFQYNKEEEHLPKEERRARALSFFRWKIDHDILPGQRIYAPLVQKSGGVFAGQVWHLFLEIEGFPEQKENLKNFSRAFNFRWFW